MITWLHTFQPTALLFSLGPINIYWYGLLIALGIIIALGLSLKITPYYKIEKELIWDLSFWLIINGLIGARLYEVFLELPYYFNQPLNIFKIWEGGLAIHGGLIAGLITIYYFSKKHKIYFWKLCALIVPGLALAQAIGRFGNYFNQELFGRPTDLPWGIPIRLISRPDGFEQFNFFHPTFLYESLGLVLIFIILINYSFYIIKQGRLKNFYFILLTALYMILYSVLRFFLEFIKIDKTPIFLGLRWPQLASLIFIFVFFIILITSYNVKKNIHQTKIN